MRLCPVLSSTNLELNLLEKYKEGELYIMYIQSNLDYSSNLVLIDLAE